MQFQKSPSLYKTHSQQKTDAKSQKKLKFFIFCLIFLAQEFFILQFTPSTIRRHILEQLLSEA